jgi:hypothetical protein
VLRSPFFSSCSAWLFPLVAGAVNSRGGTRIPRGVPFSSPRIRYKGLTFRLWPSGGIDTRTTFAFVVLISFRGGALWVVPAMRAVLEHVRDGLVLDNLLGGSPLWIRYHGRGWFRSLRLLISHTIPTQFRTSCNALNTITHAHPQSSTSGEVPNASTLWARAHRDSVNSLTSCRCGVAIGSLQMTCCMSHIAPSFRGTIGMARRRPGMTQNRTSRSPTNYDRARPPVQDAFRPL